MDANINAKMDTTTALENLKYVRPRLAVTELGIVRENRDEAVPVLLERLKTAADAVSSGNLDDYYGDEYYDPAFYAMYMLAEFRAAEALPLLLQVLKGDSDDVDMLLGDLLTEGYGQMIAMCATPEDAALIKEIASNRELNEFHRCAALKALVVMWVEDVLPREVLVDFLAEQIGLYIGMTDEEFDSDEEMYVSSLIDYIAPLHADGLHDDAKAFLARGLIDWRLNSVDEFDKRVKEAVNTKSGKQMLINADYCEFLGKTEDVLSKWHFFRDKPKFDVKVGRNEPCPCGSGNKYKRCCL